MGIVTGFTATHLPRLRLILMTFGVLAAIALTGSYLSRGHDWHTSWRLQQKTLAEAPVERLAALPSGTNVFIVAPIDVNGAPVFASPWDINQAMPITHRATSHLQFIIYSKWMGPANWDGSKLTYEGYLITEKEPIYILKPEWREFYKAERPFKVNQDMTIVTP